jgi:hypothetical protein
MLPDFERADRITVKRIETGDALLEASGLHIVDQGEPVTVPVGYKPLIRYVQPCPGPSNQAR